MSTKQSRKTARRKERQRKAYAVMRWCLGIRGRMPPFFHLRQTDKQKIVERYGWMQLPRRARV